MLNKIFSFFLLAGLLVILATACSNNGGGSSPEGVVKMNAEYMDKEDLDGSLSTIHPESPAYESSKQMTSKLFEVYDLDYKLEKVELVEENKNEARVKFVQLTTKKSGPEFRNNRFTGVHILRKYNGNWKIYSTESVNVDYVD